MGWKVLSIGAFVQGYLMQYFKVEFVTLFWCLCFLCSGIIAYFVIIDELEIKVCSRYKLLFSSLTAIVLWISSYSHITQTIFWATGGFYSFSLLVGAVWIRIFLILTKKKPKKLQQALFVIFTFMAATNSQNLTVALFVLVLITLIINSNKNNYFNYIVLLFLILGVLFIGIAPGNKIRMAAINNPIIYTYSFVDYFVNFYEVFKAYRNKSYLLFGMSLGLGFCYKFLLEIKKEPNTNSKIEFKNRLLTFLEFSKWFWVAVSTITPFIFLPMMAAERTSIFFMFFSLIFIVLFGIRVAINFNFSDALGRVVSYVLFSLLIGYTSFFVFQNLKKGFVLKAEMQKREKLLLASKHKVVKIKVIPLELKSPCYDFYDLRNDPNGNADFMIYGHENYFKLKKLIILD